MRIYSDEYVNAVKARQQEIEPEMRKKAGMFLAFWLIATIIVMLYSMVSELIDHLLVFQLLLAAAFWSGVGVYYWLSEKLPLSLAKKQVKALRSR